METSLSSTKKTILVFGATGQQGGVVSRHLLANGWDVRAFTREGSSGAAQELRKLGAAIFEGNMDDTTAILAAMKGCYGVFSVQPPSWVPTSESDMLEETRGKLIATAALQTGVSHLVYSSVLGSNLMEDFRPGFKYGIEKYIWNLGIPATILRPAGFMENFYLPQVGVANGFIYDPTSPNLPVTYIALRDIAYFTGLVFSEPIRFIGHTFDLAGDKLPLSQIATKISTALAMEIKNVQIPMEDIRSYSEILSHLMSFLNTNGYPDVDFSNLRSLHPDLLDFDAWLDQYGKDRLLDMLLNK